MQLVRSWVNELKTNQPISEVDCSEMLDSKISKLVSIVIEVRMPI
jgi:uncharacterized protein YidB (DUF937 family)